MATIDISKMDITTLQAMAYGFIIDIKQKTQGLAMIETEIARKRTMLLEEDTTRT